MSVKQNGDILVMQSPFSLNDTKKTDQIHNDSSEETLMPSCSEFHLFNVIKFSVYTT
jgi:hypothetical protein